VISHRCPLAFHYDGKIERLRRIKAIVAGMQLVTSSSDVSAGLSYLSNERPMRRRPDEYPLSAVKV